MLVITYRGDEAAQEHKEIFEAALARDPKKASHALEKHIIRGLNHRLDAMRGHDHYEAIIRQVDNLSAMAPSCLLPQIGAIYWQMPHFLSGKLRCSMLFLFYRN